MGEWVLISEGAYKYADDPQRIEMDATSVRNSILTKIGTEELPRSEEIQDLLDALRDAAQAIRATDPDIAENRRILQSANVQRLSPEAIQTIRAAAPVLEAITEGELRDQIRDDVAVLSDYDGQLNGVTRRDGFGHDEIIRVAGRVSRIISALRKTPQIISKIEASSVIKLGDIIGSVGGIMTVLGGVVTAIEWVFKFLS